MPEIKECIQLSQECATYCLSVENITAFYISELVYLLWAETVDPAKLESLPYKHAEWIRLHAGPVFCGWVSFLESNIVRLISHKTISSIGTVFKKITRTGIRAFQFLQSLCLGYA